MKKVHEATEAVTSQITAAKPIRDLTEGGAHMRSQGETYLPKFPSETDDDYKSRKDSTWLFDGVGKAIEDYVGRLFDKPFTCADEGELGEWCENIDLEGQDLSNFAQPVFEAQVKDGITFIMADAPPREGEMTRAQVDAAGIRPYLVHIKLSEVLGWKFDTSGNAPILSQFRFMETVAKPDRDEFSDETVEQIRVLDLNEGNVRVRLYQKKTATGKGTEEWQVIEDGEYQTDQTQIMIAPVYSRRVGLFMAKPPLARLAEINLAHWRSQSDQSNIMHHARAPLKYFHGYDKDTLKGAENAPGYAFVNPSPEAKVGVIEHGGAAIEAGRTELKDLEQQMQWVGLQLVLSKASGTTATGDMIDEKKNTSALSMWADNLKDALEISLGWMNELGGSDGDATVTMSKDFVALNINSTDMDILIKMGVSDELLLNESKRRGIISEDVDIETERDRMKEQNGVI